MKIVVVDTYYGAFLRSHYSADADLADAPYDEQHAALMARRFGTSDFYSRHLRALGHEAVEIVANCLPLQRRWAREHGGRAPLPGYLPERVLVPALRRLLVRQVETLKPDVVYVQDVAWVGPAAPALREHARLLVGQHASTAPPPEVVSPYDLLISSLPNLVERFRSDGTDSEYLPLGFEPGIVDELPQTAPAAESSTSAATGRFTPSETTCSSRSLRGSRSSSGAMRSTASMPRPRSAGGTAGKPGAPRCTTCEPPLGSR